MNPAIAHVLQFFEYDHLPEPLRTASARFAVLAHEVAETADNQETTVALRKLLEAKDAAVRALLTNMPTRKAHMAEEIAADIREGTFVGASKP